MTPECFFFTAALPKFPYSFLIILLFVFSSLHLHKLPKTIRAEIAFPHMGLREKNTVASSQTLFAAKKKKKTHELTLNHTHHHSASCCGGIVHTTRSACWFPAHRFAVATGGQRPLKPLVGVEPLSCESHFHIQAGWPSFGTAELTPCLHRVQSATPQHIPQQDNRPVDNKLSQSALFDFTVYHPIAAGYQLAAGLHAQQHHPELLHGVGQLRL